MCKFCNFNGEWDELLQIQTYNYVGEQLQTIPANDEVEVCLFDDPDSEQVVLEIESRRAPTIKVDIKFCPMCGRKLN